MTRTMDAIVYILGVAILAGTPALGQWGANENSLFGSLFGDAPIKDVDALSLGGLGEKQDEAGDDEVENMTFDSPLAKILAMQEALNNEQNDVDFDANTEDTVARIIEELEGMSNEDERETLMSLMANNNGDDNNDIDFDRRAINYMTELANEMPESVENMIENLPLTKDDFNTIEGYESVVEEMIAEEMKNEAAQTDSDSDEEEVGVVDYGGILLGGGGVLGGEDGGIFGGNQRRWGRRGRFGGGGGFGGRFRKEQQQQQEEEQQRQRQQQREREEAGRRALRRRKQQQQQQQEQQQQSRRQRQQESDDDTERSGLIANTFGRARSGWRVTADITRGNMLKAAEWATADDTREAMMKAAEFTAENAYKTAMGLGGAMVDVNDELTEVVSNVDWDPINDAATKTAGFLVDVAQRNVPGEIVNGLLTTAEGSPLETVKAVLLNSKTPEAMIPIVEEVSGNYVNVIKQVKGEMDGFLKFLFRAAPMTDSDFVDLVE